MLDVLKRMRDRVRKDGADSDSGAYTALSLELQLVVKLTASALVACVRRDREGHHYRQAHQIARGSSIGDFVAVADEILVGPTSHFAFVPSKPYCRDLTQNVDKRTWQYAACQSLYNALSLIDDVTEALPARLQGRRWLNLAASFRNASIAGHGAESQAQQAKLIPLLQESIDAFVNHLELFSTEWAYIHRKMSGRYRVIDLGCGASRFDDVRSNQTGRYEDGIYIAFDDKTISRVEFLHTDVDLSDYFLANGQFNGKYYQAESYITGSKRWEDASAYLRAAGDLPKSETHGNLDLGIVGSVFSNIPAENLDYISRPSYEEDLGKVLVADNHPIVTLSGRGGIGKTSIALRVLHGIARGDRFFAIIWLSARDVDLLDTGPKAVRPAVLTVADVVKEVVRYLGLHDGTIKESDARKLVSEQMTKSEIGPLLFVFDNFETFVDPADLFTFIDTFVRPPNKVLITSRERVYFRGDYGIEVAGMEEGEAESLINVTAKRLNIANGTLSHSYRADLIKESAGHPYIMKFLLGEVARGKPSSKVERILATDDAMLQALFERTYATLTPAAKRVFMTLCTWRSRVFRLALEAVLLRPQNERIEPTAIDELIRSSFIESTGGSTAAQAILSVPLVAQIFGRGKLSLSPASAAIEADSAILQLFGAMQATDDPTIFDNRLQRFMGSLETNEETLLPVVEFIASRHVEAWWYLAGYYDDKGDARKARHFVERFIERTELPELRVRAWSKYTTLSQRLDERLDEVRGLVELAVMDGAPFGEISEVANRLNNIFHDDPTVMQDSQKREIASRVADVLQARITEGDATDRSRLSWLYQRLGNRRAALDIAAEGLRLDPSNEYCRRIVFGASRDERARYF